MAVEYAAVKQLLQMTCSNCHVKQLVDPTQPEDLASIADWLKVQKSSGETFAFCGVECAHKGIHVVKSKPDHGLEIVGE